MSWDIYGNPLRRGHCEVHPHVHEEFPCSICMEERGRRNEPHNEMEQLQHDFAMQGDYIRQLETERKELTAQVEQLREQLEYMAQQHRCGCGHPACNRCYDDKQNAIVLEATPAQCLAEHDVKVIAAAYEDYRKEYVGQGMVTWFNGYMNKLRQQAKENYL